MLGRTVFTLITPLLLGSPLTYAQDPSEPDPVDALAPAVVELSFDEAIANVARLDEIVAGDPSRVTELEEALGLLVDFAPQLAADETSLEIRRFARLNVAQAYRRLDEPDKAELALDEAVREAMGAEVPASSFGRKFNKFFSQRFEVFDARGRATLEVRCELPCKVYVNEVEVAAGPQELHPGDYRVWVESPMGERGALREVVDLNEVGASVEVEFASPPPPLPEIREEEEEHEERRGQVMPLKTEVGMLFTGLGLSVLGSVLAAVGGANGNTDAVGGGAAMVGIGAAVMITGGVTLSVDLQRGAHQQQERTATVTLSRRF